MLLDVVVCCLFVCLSFSGCVGFLSKPICKMSTVYCEKVNAVCSRLISLIVQTHEKQKY